MSKLRGALRRERGELAVFAMRCLLYAGLFFLFFGLLSIENWQLKNISRTLATTLITWSAMTIGMYAVYGGYDVHKRKSRPVIGSLLPANVLTDLVTFLQLQVMNVNEHNHDRLTLFGEDFKWLLLAIVLQSLFIIFMVRFGSWLYFHLTPPRKCLLVLSNLDHRAEIEKKISRYRLQWQVTDVALYNAPDISERVAAAEVVFLAELPENRRLRLMKLCYDHHRDMLCKAQETDIMLASARPIIVDDAPFLEMDYRKMTLVQRFTKRLADIVVSALALLIFSPAMAIIALCIRIEDGAPVIFRQERLTAGGRRFSICKFRTMHNAVKPEDFSAECDDKRVTRVGAFLRKYRLDELPQFWNILRGDMSLVGPRPEMLANIERYKNALPAFVYREKMKAGLTGYAQIEGRYNTSAEDKLMLDLIYIESFSLWLDVRLLLRTVTVFFKPDSTQGFAHKPEGENRTEATEENGGKAS